MGILVLILVAAVGACWPRTLVIQKNHGVLDVETLYNRVWIYDSKGPDQNAVRVMRINNEINSAMYINSDELVYDYLKFFHLADRFGTPAKSLLMLGGGAFSFPMDIVRNKPGVNIDVVEIDPKFEILARDHFRLVDNPRLQIHNEDGRVFLNQTNKRFDTVLIDAFQSMSVIPFQLTTLEAVERIHNLLEPSGVVMINIIGSLLGENSNFLMSEINVYRHFFNHIYLFPLRNPDDGLATQNIVLVATNNSAEPKWITGEVWGDKVLKNFWPEELICTGDILSDNHAPVEYFGWLGR